MVAIDNCFFPPFVFASFLPFPFLYSDLAGPGVNGSSRSMHISSPDCHTVTRLSWQFVGETYLDVPFSFDSAPGMTYYKRSQES